VLRDGSAPVKIIVNQDSSPEGSIAEPLAQTQTPEKLPTHRCRSRSKLKWLLAGLAECSSSDGDDELFGFLLTILESLK
jgi:hypothetical protein